MQVLQLRCVSWSVVAWWVLRLVTSASGLRPHCLDALRACDEQMMSRLTRACCSPCRVQS